MLERLDAGRTLSVVSFVGSDIGKDSAEKLNLFGEDDSALLSIESTSCGLSGVRHLS